MLLVKKEAAVANPPVTVCFAILWFRNAEH
eukprot:COSAG05_NODE_21663_length_270_cov_0.608187_1_plen_29_part_01